jgi:hypothetical protein
MLLWAGGMNVPVRHDGRGRQPGLVLLSVRSAGSPQPRGLSVPLGAACLMHPPFLAGLRDQRLDVLGGELPQCQRDA